MTPSDVCDGFNNVRNNKCQLFRLSLSKKKEISNQVVRSIFAIAFSNSVILLT